MAHKELKWQNRIIDSAKLQGGHGGKWSSRFQVGKPDLVLAIPGVGAFVAEVKLVLHPKPEFTRRLDVTEIQAEELRRFDVSGALSVILAVDLMPSDRALTNVWLWALPHSARSLGHLHFGPRVKWEGASSGFDLKGLMANFNEQRYRHG